LFFGDRSDATMMLVAFLWLYERSVKRIPRTSLVAGIAVLITLYPLIRINRALTGIERLSPSVWVEALSRTDNPVRSSIAEMGGSLGVLAHVINLVPDARPFDYGGSYFWAITSIFPNVSGGLHPSAQRSLSTWLINTIDPSGAERGGGAGFSFLAEAYLNFGWYGVVGIPMLIGATLSIVTRWSASTRTPAGWAAVACMLEIMPKFARSEALEQVRWIAWVCVGLYLTCRLLERRKMRGIFIAHIRPRLIFYSPDCKSNN
jgi:oligosaccharide repeat unit polymerase